MNMLAKTMVMLVVLVWPHGVRSQERIEDISAEDKEIIAQMNMLSTMEMLENTEDEPVTEEVNHEN